MIICQYNELSNYVTVLPKLKEALACVEELRSQGFPTGRYEYEGGFLFVQRGSTKAFSADDYEAHKKYIDIKKYEPNNDIAFYLGSAHKGSQLRIREGMCWVAYPADGHMPCRYEESASDYVKIIMKLPYER